MMTLSAFRSRLPLAHASRSFLFLVFLSSFLTITCVGQKVQEVLPREDGLTLQLSDGTLQINALAPDAFEVVFAQSGQINPPSHALVDPTERVSVQMTQADTSIQLDAGILSAVIDRESGQITFVKDGETVLAEEAGFFAQEEVAGFRFRLQDHEILMGGGSRVLGMDRRGHRLELQNKPSYGYETDAPLMYYSLPAVLSSAGYVLFFDNGAKGFLDLGATESDVLEFSAGGGRMSYVVSVAADWPGLTRNLTTLTGRQPMPPRWALGNIASRMGYRSQAQVEWVADGFRAFDVPLDAIIIDLYWFGPDLKGHMGNLEWDRAHWPEPEQMMADLRNDGIKTILITEPFILEGTAKFDEVIAQDLVGTTADGEAYTYDFYFGHTALLDIFKPETRAWFWDIYRDFTEAGVAGWWGDLGEPEVHPEDLFHSAGQATEVHNLYGHEWARLVFDGFAQDFPAQRPVILMRAGFLGSQRYGMIPWTGDVNRTWGGLKPQVELSLQMGMQGLAYMHSDLGGFAGNEHDAELYTRWMQYGVFQPIYRPHAQEEVASEPIFWDTATLDIVRDYIDLRYALTPYNYTLWWENSMTGMPMMRPLFYVDDDPDLLTRTDGYLWGDAFLVYPVTDPLPLDDEGQRADTQALEVYFPDGANWYGFFDGAHYAGGQTATVEVPLEELPVFVKGGSFVPMIPPVQTLDDYPHDEKTVHFYYDATVTKSTAQLYEDDGMTPETYTKGAFEIFDFFATVVGDDGLDLRVERSGGDFSGRSEDLQYDWVIHHWPAEPDVVTADDGTLLETVVYDAEAQQLRFTTEWDDRELVIRLR